MTSQWCFGSSTISSEQELGGAAHQRIILSEKIFVAAEGVMFPQMLAEPSAADGPHAIFGRVHRRRAAPEIGVVMDHPAAAVVIGLGGLRAGLGEVLDQPEQGLVAFGQIADLGGPVIHLQVDVDGVFAAPGRQECLVPDALEIGRLAADAAAGGQNISAELEAERFEIRIGTRRRERP